MIAWVLLLVGYLAFPWPVLSSKNPTSTPRPSVQSSHRLMGRHVCVQNKVVTRPSQRVESYCKPVYKTYTYVCDQEKYRLCSSFRVVYEKAVRTVRQIAAQTETVYVCCPGWRQTGPGKHDCTQAVCSRPCQNGGKCKKPDHCLCPSAWTGKTCQTDVDECAQQPATCQQRCLNLPGSYSCGCQPGFALQPDGTSCKINLGTFPEYQRLVGELDRLDRKLAGLQKWQEKNGAELSERMQVLTEAVAVLSKSSSDSPLDRLNSLSEQIAILEERLGTCSCRQEVGTNAAPAG